MARRKKPVEAPIENIEVLEEELIEEIETLVETPIEVKTPIEEVSKKQSMKVLNLRDNILSIGMVSIPSRGEVPLSEDQLKDENTMRRINHAIKIGLIKEV